MTAARPKLLTLGSCLLAGAFAAYAQTAPVTCTAATLSGTHSIVLTGRNVSSTAVLSNVFLATGTATFDGVSAATLSLTVNTNSTPGVVQNWAGTYSLPANCLGTMTIATGDSASFTLIPYNKGSNFTITGQDATYSYTGTGSVAPATCITASLSGSYAFTGNGYILSGGAVTGVNTISGLLNFDGAGTIQPVSWSVTTNGTTVSDTFASGKYTVSPSCTATATVTDTNGVPYTISFTLTTADGANFGVNIATASGTFTGNGHSTFTYPGLAVELAAGAGLTTPAGSIFSIYGFNLSTGTAPATGFPLPPTLASASVTVNGEAVPLYYVNNKALGTEGLINAVMPWDIQPGVALLVVKNGTTVSNSVAINIPSTPVPALFTYGTATGASHAEAQNLPSFALNSSTSPANVGDTVVVYFTGGGPVQNQNQIVTGQATPAAAFSVTAMTTATIAGVAATIDYIGLAPTEIGGYYQANIVIPKVAAGDRNLVITVGGKASNAALISVN